MPTTRHGPARHWPLSDDTERREGENERPRSCPSLRSPSTAPRRRRRPRSPAARRGTPTRSPARARRSVPARSRSGRRTTSRRPARRSTTTRSARAAASPRSRPAQVDFGASDAPLTPDQFDACKGCVQIPWALSATSIIYNLPGVPNNLKLTGPVIANIYLGKITKWDDPAIKKLNPGVNLPDTKITPVYRSDGSGTTYNFTDYLSAVSPAWKSKIGTRRQRQLARPAVGGRGCVRRRRRRLEHAGRDRLRRHRVRADEQAPVRVGAEHGRQVHDARACAAITAAAATGQDGAGEQRAAHRQPAEGRPARLPDLHVHVRDPADEDVDKAAELRKFVFYALDRRARSSGRSSSSSPLPKVVLVASEKTLKKVQG